MRPEHVAPVIVFLASDVCEVNGQLWSVGAGSVARLFVGRTQGFYKHPAKEGTLSPEDVAMHVAEIADSSQFTELPDWPSEWQIIAEQFGAGS